MTEATEHTYTQTPPPPHTQWIIKLCQHAWGEYTFPRRTSYTWGEEKETEMGHGGGCLCYHSPQIVLEAIILKTEMGA